MKVDEFFLAYKSEHPAREPDLSNQRFPDEVEDLRGHADVYPIVPAPIAWAVVGVPSAGRGDQGANKFLWVVGTDDLPSALEAGELGKTRQRGYLAHTNLTGGRPAHAGGEMWFKDDRSIWLTGGSGRYRPRSADELEAIATAFRRAGFVVASCGWDGVGPARFFRGEPEWK